MYGKRVEQSENLHVCLRYSFGFALAGVGVDPSLW